MTKPFKSTVPNTIEQALRQIFKTQLPASLMLLEAKPTDTKEITKIRASLATAMTYRAIARIEKKPEAELSQVWSMLVGLLIFVKREEKPDNALNRPLWKLINDTRNPS